ncbi:MAG: Enolase-phosphatase [Myxococcales bacterium]|nr:Enolase-phosphatase [Myxococcales bacterium]
MTAIVTDIEGTTSSIAFVKHVLFPYARRRLPDFVRLHAARADVAPLVEEVRSLAGDLDTDGVIRTLLGWIDEDRKVPPLKQLQGMIWAEGYAEAAYRGHVYRDAAAALRRWHAAGVALYVYSSGSVEAQQLLFAHSEAGDLASVFSGYFDTRIGAKTEVSSYRAIASKLGGNPARILFLSDQRRELDAAAAAGLRTVLVCRDGAPLEAAGHPVVTSFDGIDIAGAMLA